MVLLKVVGLFKTIAIILLIFFVIRFISRLMAAKTASQATQRAEKEKAYKEKNKGKVSITRNKNISAEDVDYTEVE